jgi:hypothetical protein
VSATSLSALRRLAAPGALWFLAAVILAAPTCRKHSAADVEGVPAGAFDRLTEDDVGRFVAVGPALHNLLLGSRAQPEHVKLTDGVPEFLAKNIDWLRDVPGIDSVLATAGLTWSQYRILLYRVTITALAIGAPEATREAERRMETFSVGVRKNMRKQIAQTKRIVEHVPNGNADVFTRHERELSASLPGSGE